MKVGRVRARGVAAKADVDVDFPTSGLVLITGPNGAGKSTIVECVPLAVWGKSIRGDVMWSPEGGEVEALVDGRVHHRARGKKTSYTIDGESEDTITKTMRAAGSGDFDMWRRTCAFSLDDRRSFCSATPSERVRVLETLTSIPGFDDAVRKARAESKSVMELANSCRTKIAGVQQRIPDWKKRLERLSSAVPPSSPEVEDVSEAELEESRSSLSEAEREVEERVSSTSGARSELSAVKRRVIPKGGVRCDKCGQEVPVEYAAGIKAEVEGEERRIREVLVAGEASLSEARAKLSHAKSRLDSLKAAESRRRASLAAHASALASHRRSMEEALELEEELANLEAELADQEAHLGDLLAPLPNYECLDAVLGTNGWRMSLMVEATKSMEVISNSWLAKMLPGATVKLGQGDTPTDMRMTIEGVGRGTYSSLSGGQRRKVEVATTIALAQLASSTAGWPDSTLFFDEVFDGLDEEGREAAASCLVDLSAERCVVVITHNEDFRKMLPSAAWYHVEEGKAVRRS